VDQLDLAEEDTFYAIKDALAASTSSTSSSSAAAAIWDHSI